ncbi:hypothetical protein AB9L15_05065 [Lysinibacillus fusiformis]|uniref:hypothetical protein n=1 Tax=Lysinibacillus fusiformis TaxID=28031 RepID=UPI0035C187E8
MKASLNILGRKHNIVSVEVQDPETGERKHFYDSEEFSFMPEDKTADLANCIESPIYEARIVEDLNQLIVDSRDHLKDLGNQIIQEALVHDGLPFGDSALPNLVKEYKEHRDYIDGVASALEVVKRDNYE